MKVAALVLAFLATSCLVNAKDDEKKIDGPVIGIDLGTTYSCVAGRNQVVLISICSVLFATFPQRRAILGLLKCTTGYDAPIYD